MSRPTTSSEPAWPKPALDGDIGAQAMFHAKAIEDELAHPPADWLVMTRDYATQSGDTAALEPDNANGWYDAAKQELHLVVADAVATGSGGRSGEPAGKKPPRPQAPVPASVLHGRLRLQGPQPDAVLRPAGRRLWRRPAGAAGLRPLRALPGRPEAAPVQHALQGRRRSADRRHAVVPGGPDRQWRRPGELLRRPQHGCCHLGCIDLLFPQDRHSGNRHFLARAGLRLGARLWRAGDAGRDRDHGRRDRRSSLVSTPSSSGCAMS